MKSLKSVARKGVIVSTTAFSALALASCSGGQITQTSQQVAAVDGSMGESEDGNVAVRDVTILVEPDTGKAALKFVAFNQSYNGDAISLESVTVDGQQVELGSLQPMGRNGSIVADSAENLSNYPMDESDETIQYVETTLTDDDYGYAGNRPVTFEFSNDTIEVDAAISASQMVAGEQNRDPESTERFTTESPKAEEG